MPIMNLEVVLHVKETEPMQQSRCAGTLVYAILDK